MLATGLAFIFLALKYVDVAARYPDGGGVVSVASDAFGPFVGCLGGILICVDYFLTGRDLVGQRVPVPGGGGARGSQP